MTEPWLPPACRTPPPCCPRPADCSSPRSSRCGRCRWATGPPAPPSHLIGGREADAQVMAPMQFSLFCALGEFIFIFYFFLPHLCGHQLQVCAQRERTRCLYGTSGQKQLRSHIRGTNVMLRYFDARYSLRIILIRKCLCKAILSSLSGAGGGGKGEMPAGTWRSSGRKCVCDHVMSVLALQPSSFHITGGCAEGGMRPKRFASSTPMVLYLYLCVLVRVIQEAAYFLCKTPNGYVCVYLSSRFDVSRAVKLRHLRLQRHWVARQRFLRVNLNNFVF